MSKWMLKLKNIYIYGQPIANLVAVMKLLQTSRQNIQMGKYEHAIMVAVLLYVQWTKEQPRAKLSKCMLKLNEKGNATTIVEDKKNNVFLKLQNK